MTEQQFLVAQHQAESAPWAWTVGVLVLLVVVPAVCGLVSSHVRRVRRQREYCRRREAARAVRRDGEWCWPEFSERG
ncbi:MAG: hypothetical protein QM679_10090 [Patulibacter sp.]